MDWTCAKKDFIALVRKSHRKLVRGGRRIVGTPEPIWMEAIKRTWEW